MDKTGTAKVNNFDFTLGVALDQNVLRLEIAMDEFQVVNVAERS